MQSARIDFSKGINKITEPRLMPEGFCLVADNIDLRSGSPRAFRFPEFFKTVTGGTTRIWEYRGKWYASDLWRDYVGEVVGNRERIYFTEVGAGRVIPQKIINGVQARLGTPVPGHPLKVTKTVEASELNLATAVVSGQSPGFSVAATNSLMLEYQVSALDAEGNVIALSNKSRSLIDNTAGGAPLTGMGITLTWNALPDAASYDVYGREVGTLERLVKSATSPYTDNNSAQADGTVAPASSSNAPYTYVYTLVRNVNGHEDESGPSPVSETVTTAGARVITRNPNAEKTFISGGDAVKFVNPSPSVVADESSVAGAIDVAGIVSERSKTTFVTLTAHGLQDGDSIGITGMLPADKKKHWYAKIPPELKIPVDVNLVLEAAPVGSTLAAATYYFKITGVRGAKSTLAGVPGGVFSDGKGAQTTASAVKSIVVGSSNDKAIEVRCAEDAEYDCAYIYKSTDGVSYDFQGTLDHANGWVYNYTGQAPDYNGAGEPTIPASNETRTRCLYVDGLASSNPIDYPSDGGGGKVWPQIIPNPTTVITIGAPHGVTGTRSVRLSGFSDDYINETWRATITSTTAFTIPYFLETTENSPTEPYTVQFSDAADEFSFYKEWRIYRTEAGEWLFVVALPMDVLTYEDRKKAEELGGTPDSWYTDNGTEIIFRPPPEGMHGIEAHYGMLFGIWENQVRWTPINRPDAWPEALVVTFPYRPLALASWGGTMVVMCSDALYQINGTIPTVMSRFKTKCDIGILAPRSKQKTERGLLYLGAPGVVLFDGSHGVCITENRIPARFWQSPSRLSSSPGFFWYPTEMTYNYAALAFNPGGYGDSGVPDGNPAVANTLNQPIDGPIYNIRSFYHDGKYYLFWSDYI